MYTFLVCSKTVLRDVYEQITMEPDSKYTYGEPQVKECHTQLERPEQAGCYCPTRELDLGPDDPGVGVKYSSEFDIYSRSSYSVVRGVGIPPYVFWIIMRERAPLSIRHAVVCETMSYDSYMISKSGLCRVDELRVCVGRLFNKVGQRVVSYNGEPDQIVVSAKFSISDS